MEGGPIIALKSAGGSLLGGSVIGSCRDLLVDFWRGLRGTPIR